MHETIIPRGRRGKDIETLSAIKKPLLGPKFASEVVQMTKNTRADRRVWTVEIPTVCRKVCSIYAIAMDRLTPKGFWSSQRPIRLTDHWDRHALVSHQVHDARISLTSPVISVVRVGYKFHGFLSEFKESTYGSETWSSILPFVVDFNGRIACRHDKMYRRSAV